MSFGSDPLIDSSANAAAIVNALTVDVEDYFQVEAFRSVGRVLRPGGRHVVALSHRCFPTKAIRAWRVLPFRERPDVVRSYFLMAGGYEPEVSDRSPAGADPLWIVTACRAA